MWELLHSTFVSKSITDGCSLDLNCNPNETCHIAPNPRHLVGKKQDFLGFPAPVQPGGHLTGLAAHPWLSFGVEHWGTCCKAAAQAELGGGGGGNPNAVRTALILARLNATTPTGINQTKKQLGLWGCKRNLCTSSEMVFTCSSFSFPCSGGPISTRPATAHICKLFFVVLMQWCNSNPEPRIVKQFFFSFLSFRKKKIQLN